MTTKKRSTWDSIREGVASILVHPEAKQIRKDGFANEFLGYGTARDKLAYGLFTCGARLSDAELYAMYYSDDVSAKGVNLRPAEIMRRGYKLCSEKNPEAAKALQKKAEQRFRISQKHLRGRQWGRLWGGCLLIIGANDSADLTLPLRPEAVRDVKFLNLVDRRYASVFKYQDDPTLPNYGEPEIYQVGGIAQGFYKVHASRVIRYDGIEETDPQTRRELSGWTYSVLQRPYDVVRAFATAHKSVEHLLVDASQGVWKLTGLLDMISSNREELMTRLQFSDMTRSAGRAVMLDAENENFERVATSFAGVPDIIDRVCARLAAAFDTPLTRLMGTSAAGLNATGEGDTRNWYDSLETDQRDIDGPSLLRVYEVLGAAEKIDTSDFEIEWASFWKPTEKEKAEIEKLRADKWKIWVDMGGLLPEQATIAEFGSGNGKPEIDEDALRKSIKQETDLMLNPPPPPPVPPPGQTPPVPPNSAPVPGQTSASEPTTTPTEGEDDAAEEPTS